RGEAAIGCRAQCADGGDDGNAEGEAQQYDPEAVHAAAQFAPCQAECQHQATGSAWVTDRSNSVTLPSATWTRRVQRAARCAAWVINSSVVPVSARSRNSSSITASPVA